MKRITQLGLPIALALFFEVTLFAIVALLVAPLGVTAVAGHQIALNFSSLMFMFPISLGIATTIASVLTSGKIPRRKHGFPPIPGWVSG